MKKAKLIQHNSRIFWSWLLSFFLILIVPLLIGIFAYNESVKIIHAETESIHTANLQQLKLLLDGKIEELHRVNQEAAINNQLIAFMNVTPPLSPMEKYKIREVQEALLKYEYVNDFVDRIFVYFPKNELFLSSSALYRNEDFEAMAESNFHMSYSELASFMKSTRFMSSRIVEGASNTAAESGTLILARAVISGSIKSPNAYLLLNVDTAKFAQVMQNMVHIPGQALLIVDGQNRMLISGQEGERPSWAEYDALKSANPLFEAKYAQENSTVMHIASGVHNWQYVSIMPTDTYLEKVNYIRTIIFVYLGLCLLLGIPAAFFLAKRNYNPLRNLIKTVVPAFGAMTGSGQNEYAFLENALENLLSERATTKTRLRQQSQALRNQFLMRLLKGRLQEGTSLQALLDRYQISFPGDGFFVMLFLIEDASEWSQWPIAQEDASDLALFVVENVAGELINERFTGYMAEIDGMVAFLVNGASEQGGEGIIEEAALIARNAKDYIKQHIGITLSIFISAVHPMLQQIPNAYAQVLETMEYEALLGSEDTVHCYRSIAKGPVVNASGFYDFYKVKQLSDYIKEGEYEAANYLFSKILTEDIQQGKYSLQMTKLFVSGLAHLIIVALGETKRPMEADFLNMLDPINRIVSAKSVTELKEQVEYILRSIIEYSNKESISARVHEIEDYIKRHSADVDLSVASICEHFQITPSYFSRIFKKHTGIKLPDYLHQHRTEKVKKLLLETEQSIADIALQTGFGNSRTLGRVFKEKEGVTPGQYREEQKKKEENHKRQL